MSLNEVVGRALKGWAAALLLATGTLAPSAARAQDESAVRVAIEGAFPPFNYLDAQKELQGFDVDIANAICAVSKLNCTLVVQPWTDIIPNLLGGRYDAIVSSMSITEERRRSVAFSVSYYNTPSIFLTGKDSAVKDTSPQALAGQRIGAVPDTIQWAYLQKRYGTSAITPFDTSEHAYAALADGRLTAVLDDKFTALDWLSNTKTGHCCRLVGPDLSDPKDFGEGVGIAFRPEDRALRERFNAAIAAIKADGTYEMINAKYFPFSIE